MIVLLSPAKTLDFETEVEAAYTEPIMLKDSKMLIRNLKKKTVEDIKQLMKVSDNIASLNVGRYKTFKTPFTTENAKQAVFAFKGDVYTGLEAETFNEEDLAFAQDHLRILSGLYGLLKPLDLMQPYRLEMGTRLENRRGKNLYEFWGEKITNQINKDLSNEKVIVNLASNEYFKSVKPKKLKGQLLHIDFKDDKNGEYKTIGFFAKKARGWMANYIIKNKITDPEQLKGFHREGYLYNPDLSTESKWVLTR